MAAEAQAREAREADKRARLAKGEIDKAANLKKGQKINLVCVGNSEIAGTPMLKDCFIQ